jgi:hypothetical protein
MFYGMPRDACFLKSVHYALKNNKTPHQVRAEKDQLKQFHDFIRSQGVETEWNI